MAADGHLVFFCGCKYRFALACILISIVLLSAQSALAQNAQLGGLVTDTTKAVIPNASVVVTNTETQGKWTAMSNLEGLFIVPAIPPGPYKLTVTATGFGVEVIDAVKLDVASKTMLNITLRPGTSQQTVTVVANANEINTTDATVSTVIDDHFVENIPLNGRSLESLMTLVPGVSSAVSKGQGVGGDMAVNGQRTEANYYTVDGVSATVGASLQGHGAGYGRGYAGTVSNTTALGTTQSMVSVDALQEFRATTSTYSAEYGRSPGGQFSFNTRSGTNTWHGLAFDYLRNGALDANNWFNNHTVPETPRQSEHQNDFGGTVGGPLLIPGVYRGEDKTFFFFSYEGLRLTVPFAAQTYAVPNLTLRQNAPSALSFMANAFPIPNGGDAGDNLSYYTAGYATPSSLDSIGIRLDHSVSDKVKIFGRYNDVQSTSAQRGGGDLAELDTQTANSKAATLGITYLPTSHLYNDLRFNYTNVATNARGIMTSFGGATVPDFNLSVPGYTTFIQGCFCYGLFPYFQPETTPITESQINVVDWMGLSMGRHNLKWGVDYRRLSTYEPFPTPQIYGQFDSSTSFLNNQLDLGEVDIYTRTNAMRPVFMNFSAFVQDEWRVQPRLNLSLGLRWELNPAPRDSKGFNPYTLDQITDLATAVLAPAGTPLWKTTYRGFAPRLGIAYQFHRSRIGETVLRGGFGLFYGIPSGPSAQGYNNVGFGSAGHFDGSAFPFSTAQLQSIPTPSAAAPYTDPVVAFDPNLKLPLTLQWNVTIQQALGDKQNVTLSYLGASGRNLATTKLYFPDTLGNTAFSLGNGAQITTSDGSSSYNALQATFQRSLSHGLQALFTYTWSHAIDDLSSNFVVYDLQRASSDFDIRNNFQAALTYNVPSAGGDRVVRTLLKQWAIDARISAVSAIPIDIDGAYGTAANGTFYYFHPNYVQGEPLYQSVAGAPGGRVINYNAFSLAEDASGNPIEGNVSRNIARAFGSVQADITLRRELRMTERLGLQFRIEAFNILNHPQFGSVYNELSDGEGFFGYAYNTRNVELGHLNPIYQTGGPRSLQLALKLHF